MQFDKDFETIIHHAIDSVCNFIYVAELLLEMLSKKKLDFCMIWIPCDGVLKFVLISVAEDFYQQDSWVTNKQMKKVANPSSVAMMNE